MILFNHMKLAEKLGRGEITESIKFWYYLIFIIAYSLSFTSYSMHSLYAGITLNAYDYINDIALIVLIFIATIVSFRINASGDNRDFIARMICLGLPIAIQILLAIIIYITIFFVTVSDATLPQTADAELSDEAGPIDLAIGIACALYFNGQLVRGISRAAKQTTENSSLSATL